MRAGELLTEACCLLLAAPLPQSSRLCRPFRSTAGRHFPPRAPGSLLRTGEGLRLSKTTCPWLLGWLRAVARSPACSSASGVHVPERWTRRRWARRRELPWGPPSREATMTPYRQESKGGTHPDPRGKTEAGLSPRPPLLATGTGAPLSRGGSDFPRSLRMQVTEVALDPKSPKPRRPLASSSGSVLPTSQA